MCSLRKCLLRITFQVNRRFCSGALIARTEPRTSAPRADARRLALAPGEPQMADARAVGESTGGPARRAQCALRVQTAAAVKGEQV